MFSSKTFTIKLKKNCVQIRLYLDYFLEKDEILGKPTFKGRTTLNTRPIGLHVKNAHFKALFELFPAR